MVLVEFHLVQNYAPSNLNRDESGSPKDCYFGGIRRARISSQCLKKNIRSSEEFKEALEETKKEALIGIRTRKMPLMVMQKLIQMKVDAKTAKDAAIALMKIGKSEKAEKAEKDDEGKSKKSGKTKEEKEIKDEDLITPQIMFFSQKEIDEIANVLKKMIDEKKPASELNQNLVKEHLNKAGIKFIPVDMAMFGRMITSEAFENVEASFQAAHAISTNKLEQEYDFFTAVEDVFDASKKMKSQGSAMMDEVEYNSSCFYKYFALDTDDFIENFTKGSKEKADLDEAKLVLKAVIKGLVKALTFNNPTGKQNSFAAHNPPQTILIEVSEKKIPMSYANAFLKPVFPTITDDLLTKSTKVLIDFVNKSAEKYKLKKDRYLFQFDEIPDVKLTSGVNVKDIDELISKVQAKV